MKMYDKKAFGKRVLFARNKAGMSQERLADAMGCTAGTIRNYEIGKSMPTVEMLVQLAENLGVSVEYLATGKGGEADGK